ncbi:MAG: 30S ribosomal protein S15, partial [Gammaproteobacteria bacterium]
MALTSEQKAEIVAKYSRGDGDTGSPEVQVALLTARIEDLAPHFREHKHDNHARQGLLRLAGMVVVLVLPELGRNVCDTCGEQVDLDLGGVG